MMKEVIIRVQPVSEKCHRKALKVAGSVHGVESVSVAGREKDLLLVIGDVDEVELTKKLQEKVGHAEIVELQTLPPGGGASMATDAVGVVVTHESPSQQWHGHYTPGRSVTGGGRVVECPVSAAAWQQQAGGYYDDRPLYHYQSPMAGQAGHYDYAGSSSYALAVARSHPANYSPMIARHDVRAVGRPHAAGRSGRGRKRDGGGPNCCSIL